MQLSLAVNRVRLNQLHKYLYCSNEPIGRWDPSGHDNFSITNVLAATSISGALIGATVGAIRGGWEGARQGFLKGALYGALAGLAIVGGAAALGALGGNSLALAWAGGDLVLSAAGGAISLAETLEISAFLANVFFFTSSAYAARHGATAADRAEGWAGMVLSAGGYAYGISCKVNPRVTPEGITPAQFAEVGRLLTDEIPRLNRYGNLGDDVGVQGSRATGTNRIDSDVDFAIRVEPEVFDQLIAKRMESVTPGSDRYQTLMAAQERGRIFAGEIGLSGLRNNIQNVLKLDTDLSIIKINGPFDNGPYIRLPKGSQQNE